MTDCPDCSKTKDVYKCADTLQIVEVVAGSYRIQLTDVTTGRGYFEDITMADVGWLDVDLSMTANNHSYRISATDGNGDLIEIFDGVYCVEFVVRNSTGDVPQTQTLTLYV